MKYSNFGSAYLMALARNKAHKQRQSLLSDSAAPAMTQDIFDATLSRQATSTSSSNDNIFHRNLLSGDHDQADSCAAQSDCFNSECGISGVLDGCYLPCTSEFDEFPANIASYETHPCSGDCFMNNTFCLNFAARRMYVESEFVFDPLFNAYFCNYVNDVWYMEWETGGTDGSNATLLETVYFQGFEPVSCSLSVNDVDCTACTLTNFGVTYDCTNIDGINEPVDVEFDEDPGISTVLNTSHPLFVVSWDGIGGLCDEYYDDWFDDFARKPNKEHFRSTGF